MKGDFSRVTFDPALHVSRVLLQQGRVLLDADFNLQSAVSAYGLRRLTRDLVGPFAGPVDADGHPGFWMSASKTAKNSLTFNGGRYYVEGWPAETTGSFDLTVSDLGLDGGANGEYLAYLDVWEEHVTWLEDNLVREPALGGPDTTTQARISWAVRTSNSTLGAQMLKEFKDGPDKAWQKWYEANLLRASRGSGAKGRVLPQMQAWTNPQAADADVPCVADPA